jgi:cytochrome c553
MTMLEQINQDLSQLDDQQLQQVAAFITKLKPFPQQKKRLSDFYGALPATHPYPGKEEIRQSIADHLIQKHHLTEL